LPGSDGLGESYAEKSGRSVSELSWYQALAIWKAAVFMEGNYKRSLAGTTDDPYLALFDEGVPQLAEAAHEITRMPAPRDCLSCSSTKPSAVPGSCSRPAARKAPTRRDFSPLPLWERVAAMRSIADG